MNHITYRVLDQFPEPAFATLSEGVFADFEASELLDQVVADEAAARKPSAMLVDPEALRIGAFRGDSLVGWTFARPDGANLLHMVNSGVAPGERRHGIYTELARKVMDHARSRGYVAVVSRHAVRNNPVIIAKLKLGFFVSGFEYSEVYGPLVRLTFLVGELRRTLYRERSSPIRRPRADGS